MNNNKDIFEMKLDNIIEMLWFSEFNKLELLTEEIINEIKSDYTYLRKKAKIDPEMYKKDKDDLLHDVDRNDNYLLKLLNDRWYYNRRGILFNTIIRCSNDIRLSMNRIKDLKTNVCPPAFDNIQSPNKDIKRILKLIDSKKIHSVNTIMRYLKEEFSKIEEDEYIVLTNGSTTGFEHSNFEILDINGIAYKPSQEFLDKTKHIRDYLGILNYRDDSTLIDGNFRSDCYGSLLYIPDKEGKIRGIYRMDVPVQIVSKKLHVKLDRVAKRIPGNYTYDQLGWFRLILKYDYHKNKYIVTTDMSKYSDTLDFQLICEIMKRVLPNSKLYEEFKWLYSLPIKDVINNKIYKSPNGSYQGQYGDFPLITIINAILQRIVYYLTGQKMFIGCAAVVGDDTGFIFNNSNKDILQIIIQVYGWAGVNINMSKTHVLDNGSGFGDFVKREITSEGIISFFNMSLYEKQNIDGAIRWIFDEFSLDNNSELCKNRLHILFGQDFGDMLFNLSILNGGIRTDVITRNDIELFKSRMNTIHGFYERPNELRIWFKAYRDTLRSMGLDLKDSDFQGWISLEGYQEWALKSGNKDMSDYIENVIFNTDYLGIRFVKQQFHVDQLLGVEPWKVLAETDLSKLNDRELNLLILLESYEKKEAIRNRERRSKRLDSVYYAMYKLPVNANNTLVIYPEIPIKNQIHYQEAIREKYIFDTACKLKSLVVIRDLPVYGNYYKYINIQGNLYNFLYAKSEYPRLNVRDLSVFLNIDLDLTKKILSRLIDLVR